MEPVPQTVEAEADGYLFELFRKLGLSDFGAETAEFLVERPLAILLIVLGAAVVSRLGSQLARRSVESLATRSAAVRQVSDRARNRARTLAGVAASVVRIFIWSVAVLLCLDKLGVNLGPLLAGASIIGVAVGFGAQSLVKDFLSGFFILAEDQYGVGDVITIAESTGTVEEVNLRVTRLRSNDGTVWYVPNGEIRKVGNAAKEWGRAIVDVTVPQGVDVNTATALIADELRAVAEDPDWAEAVLEAPEVLGVEALDTEGLTVRVSAKTQPADRARVGRQLRARIVARLQREGEFGAGDGGPGRTARPPAGSEKGSGPGAGGG